MSSRLFAANCPVIHCAARRGARWPRVVAFVLGSLLLGWLLSSCEEQEPVSTWVSGLEMGLLFFFTCLVLWLAVRKAWQDEAFYAALREGERESEDWLAMAEKRPADRSVRAPFDDVTVWMVGPLESLSEPMPDPAASECRAPGEDVFEPLRAPGEAIPSEDVHRILVACAAEGRCVMKHVRRAQETLSVEDYGDELRLAERKLDAVVRCVEALIARCAGMTKPECRMTNEGAAKKPVILGDIEQCELEGGVL